MNNRISRGLRNFALLAGLGLLMPLAAKAAALATFTANNQTITALAGDTVTGSYTVGGTGFNNDALQITGGVTVSQPGNSNGFVVGVAGHTGNSLLVSGSGSTLNSVNNFFDVNAGSSVTVSSGGNMTAGGFGTTFSAAGASTITITGTGSTWNAGGINLNAASGSLSVLAGGTVTTGSTSTLIIGNTYNLNTVTVSGAGSVFTQKAQVKVGTTGASSNNNALMIGTGGTMNVTDLGNTGLGIIVNGTGSNTGNKVQIDGGTLNVVSAGSSTPAINITKGALILNSGNVTTEVLLANTDATSVVTFNGGTLTTSSTTIANSAVFTVGNGTSAAALVLNGGTHSFANGLAISNNATLSGTGTVTGNAALTGTGIINLTSGSISGTLGVTGGNWNGAGSVAGAVTSSSGTFTIGSGANLTADGGLNVTGGTIAAIDGTSKITGSVSYSSTGTSTYNGVIAGASKTLAVSNGSLTLGGTNTYGGGTTLTAGTLVLASNSAAGNSAAAVTLSGSSAATLQINSGVTIANNITVSDANATITRQVAASGNYSVGTGGTLASSLGGTNTAASILAGTNSSGSLDTITLSFQNTSGANNDTIRTSDVFILSGVHNLGGNQTDLFVLELNASTVAPGNFIGWINGSNSWVNAVSGNTGNNATVPQQGYAGAFSSFQTTYGSTLSNYVGAYGVDVGNGNVWAVLNHNSDFGVVPEPATWALLAFSLTTVMVLRRRRNS